MPPKIRFSPTSKAPASVATLAFKHHAHRCTTCGRRFTDACGQPEVNTSCMTCKFGHSRPLWHVNHDPQPCCVGAQVMTDPREVVRYSLGGPGPWYQCSTCHRTHPNPVKEVR